MWLESDIVKWMETFDCSSMSDSELLLCAVEFHMDQIEDHIKRVESLKAKAKEDWHEPSIRHNREHLKRLDTLRESLEAAYERGKQ
jgi:hypothetical protein